MSYYCLSASIYALCARDVSGIFSFFCGGGGMDALGGAGKGVFAPNADFKKSPNVVSLILTFRYKILEKKGSKHDFTPGALQPCFVH